jgi:serine/threonine protein kinase
MLHACQRLGDFEIIRQLGKGGMGEVYEAQQFNPPRRVALKVLAPWLAEDDDALQRFWREAAVPAQLDHPAIIRIIATGKTEGVAWFTMQLVRGLSLTQVIRLANATPAPSPNNPTTPEVRDDHTPSGSRPAEPLPEPTGEETPPPILERYRQDRYGVVVQVGIQAALALASAHRQGVLHRDVKPSNLMVDHHDQLYVVDFGLTRALTTADGTSSRPGAIRGTPWYMSPEQARGEALDARSDLYSLGVTLYELASAGVGPFTASRQNAEAVLEEVRAGKILPLRTLAPDIPPALERIIHRAIQFNSKRRYASGEELAADLKALLPSSGSSRLPKRSGQRWLRGTLALGGAVLLLALIAAAVVWWRPTTGKQVKPDPGTPEPIEPPAKPAPEPLPAVLRKRLEDHRFDLLKRNQDPLWGKKLFGKGGYSLMPMGLSLMSLRDQSTTLIALDDPGARAFEFAVEVMQIRSKPSQPANAVGVFFGWNRAEQAAGRPVVCFLLQLHEARVGEKAPGRVTLEAAVFDEARGAKQASIGRAGVLSPEQKIPPLPVSPTGWRRMQVRVLDHKVRVQVDQHMMAEFDSKRCTQPFGEAGPELSPTGALGIWASDGGGFFREASIIIRPAKSKPD